MRKIFTSTVLSIALAAGLAACAAPAQQAVEPAPTVLPAVQAESAVIAEAKVVPASTVSLSFERGGTVAEILVEEGAPVEAGQPIARLDTRDLALQVEQAQVSLEQAQADYDKLLEGATPEQVAAAQAEIARAQGSLQATQSSVTEADIAAARAELESARAALAQLEAGAKSTDRQSAQASVDQARSGLDQAGANLQSQRDALAQAKVNAELNLEKAANALRNAQDEYSRIMWDNKELEKLPGDLPQELRDREAAAQRAVADGETALAQAQLTLEQARQAEITGVQAAEAQVRDAEARLEKLLSPADADARAAARAQVAAAQARLAQLTGGERQGNVAAAQAGVSAAEAQLAEIQSGPTEATLSGAAARVRGAEVSLKQAQLALEKATLAAPIAGTVAQLNLKVGEVPAAGAAVVVADLSSWEIETEDLTELSVVRVREGDQVTVTFDALPGFELPGTVSEIKPLGENRQGDIVYTVVVKPNTWDERLRWNMTASVNIDSAVASN